MPHTRRMDQAVEAFGISRRLLAEARKRADNLGMTKSGYFRYAFAKELGYPEAEAREIAMYRSVSFVRRRAGPPRTARAKIGPAALSPAARKAAVAAQKEHFNQHHRSRSGRGG